jgi:hypothetical protein
MLQRARPFIAPCLRKRHMPRTTTTKLDAQDQVILFCAAIGIDRAAVGIQAQAMQSMAVRGFIEHDHVTRAYVLTDSGRATLGAILERAEIGFVAISRS